MFGESCRTCYTDVHAAREVERRLRLGETVGLSDIESEDVYDDRREEGGRHVVMCDTLRPPPSPDCTRQCRVKIDTVGMDERVMTELCVEQGIGCRNCMLD